MWLKILGGVAVLGLAYMADIGSPQVSLSDTPYAQPEIGNNQSRRTSDNTVEFAPDDPAIEASRVKARQTFSRFERMWEQRHPGKYSVKFPLQQNGRTEHIWLIVDAVKDGNFTGRLGNKPVYGNQYEIGQVMTVQAAQIEDWMVADGDSIFGGYSARIMLEASNDERSKDILAMFKD